MKNPWGQEDLGVLHTFHWLDLRYTVEMTPGREAVEWSIYRIKKRRNNQFLYPLAGGRPNDVTDNLAHAERHAHGWVNGDGCWHVYYDNRPVHHCHFGEMKDCHRMETRLYKQACLIMDALAKSGEEAR